MWTCPKCRQRVDDGFEICWNCGTTVDGVEDPHFLDDRIYEKQVPHGPEAEVTPDSLVTLAKCSLPGQAHAMRVRLESEGIPVFLFDEFTVTMDWLLSNAIGGVKVQVPGPYLERAQAIIDHLEDQREERIAREEIHGEDAEHHVEEGIVDLSAKHGIQDKSVMEGVTEQKPPPATDAEPVKES